MMPEWMQPVFGHAHTVTLDDELLARTEQMCGPLACSALFRQALQALVQRVNAKILAAPGGSESGIDPVRGTPINRAFSHCLITSGFPISSSYAARQANKLSSAFRLREHG
jgi:hypothetical protein